MESINEDIQKEAEQNNETITGSSDKKYNCSSLHI